MADLSADLKRLFVRNLLWDAQEASITLAAQLKLVARARLEAVGKGKALVMTSGNGHQSTFEVPKDFTTTDAAELASEILDRYDEASARLIAAGDASPTDTEIHDEILARINKVVAPINDYSALRDGPSESSEDDE